jgi:MFS family permease
MQKESDKKVPQVVWYLGFVSLFNDIASEMLYPILPIFITQILGAPVFVVGIIEGLAEGTASLFKAIFGYWSDTIGRRKPFVVTGYGLSAIAKGVIALSYSWPLVLVGRTIDRLGKGARTGARDALLLEATEEHNKGYIFGIHRALDSAGAVIGPTLSLILLSIFHNDIRRILFIATLPSLVSLCFFFLIKESKKKLRTNKISLSLSLRSLSPKLKMFLVSMTLFSLGNSSDTFLILKAKNVGLSLVFVIFAYIIYNLIYSLASVPAGKLADKIGSKKVLMGGLIIYSFVYLAFAVNHNPSLVWILFGIYGFYIALTDGVSKAIIGEHTKNEDAGVAYGVFYTVTSIATLFASIIGGFLWTYISPSAPFFFAAACALISLIFLSTT